MANVLILGSGGREHTLAWRIAKSPICDALYVAPGNGGTQSFATNVLIPINEFEKVKWFIEDHKIDLLIVGPEEPLVNGIRDYLLSDGNLKNLMIIGPGKDGARLEGSKEYAKHFMQKYNIPTAAFRSVTPKAIDEGRRFLKNIGPPYVLKADGLAAGKGVVILDDLNDALTMLDDMVLQQKFGKASEKVVLEEYLSGIELSVFILTDGKSYKILPEAKDYKRIGENNTGLNTGGMGAVSPVPFSEAFYNKIENKIINPTLQGLRSEHIQYVGFIFFGLINVNDEPYVIEYNARLGDPEAQVILPRIQSDFLSLLMDCANGKLSEASMSIDQRCASTIVMASEGYPGSYKKGMHIETALEENDHQILFHAGTRRQNGFLLTNGGRVLAATGLGINMENALSNSYALADHVEWQGKYLRRDIGKDILKMNY